MLGDERVTDAYTRNAEFWIGVIREGLDPYQRELTDPALYAAIGDPAGLDILDAGCGEGYLARELAARGARHVHGVDTCAEFVDAARAHPGHRPEVVSFHHADVAALPLPDDSVDLVVANRLPNGITSPAQRFSEFARVLRPTGRAILLGMHPCFYAARAERGATGDFSLDAYFGVRTVEQPFTVAGRVSPAASVQSFYSLEHYVGMVLAAGFAITGLSEPHPSATQRQQNPWWSENFTRPLFLLLQCTPRR
ncbi:class I SAM-dependent methyltransferase [Nocardia sp. 2]|uniref:Class I SAM-dependent methyltransferase n=1 Tax=Nocardia acididurans TaxID=2802282 RepID=A0ABS1MHE0_9NOCA|nr:class I SAM-dependent methyltransferase [Nocardia acididurans]MBL1080086.1 class I SAM-dependent methyltransferase [Nocardia acididurans]